MSIYFNFNPLNFTDKFLMSLLKEGAIDSFINFSKYFQSRARSSSYFLSEFKTARGRGLNIANEVLLFNSNTFFFRISRMCYSIFRFLLSCKLEFKNKKCECYLPFLSSWILFFLLFFASSKVLSISLTACNSVRFSGTIAWLGLKW